MGIVANRFDAQGAVKVPAFSATATAGSGVFNTADD
jgi:hypothetical protein